MKEKHILGAQEILNWLGSFWLGFFFLAIILALAGFFYSGFFYAFGLFGIAFFVWLGFRKFSAISVSRDVVWVAILAFLFVVSLSFFVEPTVFSGRDQGSFSEAAIYLSQNHRLEFSFPAEKEFFNIYGPGKALNFPGFNYTSGGNLITSFPLGYVAWLSAFFSVFGLPGFIVANGVSLFVFFLSFYLLAKRLLSGPASLVVFLLAISSFVFAWFFKFTLGENLALMLIWLGALNLHAFFRTKQSFNLNLAFLSLGLLLFVRIEAGAFLAVAFGLVLWKKTDRKKIFNPQFIGILGALILAYVANLFVDREFFIVFLKDIIRSFSSSGVTGNDSGFLSESFFSLKVLWAYGILSLVILGILGAIYAFKTRVRGILIPFILVLPSFIYLIDPHISNDHPWMLRRFAFSILPASILYGTLFLDRFFRKKSFFYAFSTVLILTNCLVLFPYFSFSPGKALLGQIQDISRNFTSSDLILVDREATGDPFSMMSAPLHSLFRKQAVYFFNPNDLSRLDLAKFSHVYFIIPDNRTDFYQASGIFDRLLPEKDYMIETTGLNVIINENLKKESFVSLPAREKVAVYGKIYFLKK